MTTSTWYAILDPDGKLVESQSDGTTILFQHRRQAEIEAGQEEGFSVRKVILSMEKT